MISWGFLCLGYIIYMHIFHITMENAKKAMKLAENELQEKEVQNLKNIIKNLLIKLKDKEKEKEEIMEDIKIIKQDIDDFRAGRLDKIKERHDVNPKADSIAPIRITIINDNRRETYPLQPHRWNYEAVWYTPGWSISGGNTLTSFDSTSAMTVLCSGTTAQNFTAGSYNLGGNGIINL